MLTLHDPGVAPVATVALPPLSAAVGFVRQRAPDPEFLRALREVSPKSDAHSWLYPKWESGEWWIPAQRWVLYQMLHPDWVDEETMAELRGPHPRSDGHFCTADVRLPNQFRCLCRHKTEAWRGGPCDLISLSQYELFHETGYVGRPFWVVQGPFGGHLYDYSEQERQILAAAGRATETPHAGQLPYAPLDARVLKKIIRYNRLQQLTEGNLEAFRKRMGKDFDLHKKAIAKEMRRQLVDILDADMHDVNEAFVRAADKGEMDALQKTTIDYDRLLPQTIERYVETGQLLHPSRMR